MQRGLPAHAASACPSGTWPRSRGTTAGDAGPSTVLVCSGGSGINVDHTDRIASVCTAGAGTASQTSGCVMHSVCPDHSIGNRGPFLVSRFSLSQYISSCCDRRDEVSVAVLSASVGLPGRRRPSLRSARRSISSTVRPSCSTVRVSFALPSRTDPGPPLLEDDPYGDVVGTVGEEFGQSIIGGL